MSDFGINGDLAKLEGLAFVGPANRCHLEDNPSGARLSKSEKQAKSQMPLIIV